MHILWIFLFAPTLWAATIHTVAGTGQAGYSGDGGPATESQIKGPFGVLKGPDGALYICDTYNHVIRRVAPNGTITTVAGQCGQPGDQGDGSHPQKALLSRPYGIELDPDDNLYIADTRNHRIRLIRK